jgi:hypothetical protein
MIDMISLSIKQVTLKAKGFPRTSILDMAWRIGRRRLLTQCILAACRYPDCCYKVDKWQIKAEMPKRQKAAFWWLLSAWSTWGKMINTTPTILAALSAGAVVVNALPVDDGSKSGDPFAVLDPQNWVNPDDSE